jgi:hypothetical protein
MQKISAEIIVHRENLVSCLHLFFKLLNQKIMVKRKLRWALVPVVAAIAFVGFNSFVSETESHIHAACEVGSDGNCVHRACTTAGCNMLINICEATQGTAICKVNY